MADENYKIQVSFFTRDNVASLEQFRDNISSISSNLKAQIDAKSQAKGGAGVFASVLMGAIMGRALGRARSSLGKMNSELKRQKSQRRKGIEDRRETREKNIYNDPYVKNIEKVNEQLERTMQKQTDEARQQGVREGRTQGAKTLNRATSRMKSEIGNMQKQLEENKAMEKNVVEAARKEGYDAASKEASKRAFEKLEKRPLESAERPGGFDFTNEAKENRRKVIQANMEAQAYKARNSDLILQNKELVKENKWKSDIYKIEMNENIETQKKLAELEKKTSESKVARSLGQQVRRQREAIQMGKDPKELTPEALKLQSKKQQEIDAAWKQHEQASIPPVEPPPPPAAPLVTIPKRRNPRTEKNREQEKSRYEEEDDRLPKMRRNEQMQTAQGDY